MLQLKDNKRVRDDITKIKVLMNLVRTGQISSNLRDWLNAPDATIDHNAACAKKHLGTGFSPYEKIEELFLQMTNLQTEADPYCTASSSRIANPVSSKKGTSATLYESHRDLKKYRKRGTRYNILDIVVQRLATQ